MATDERRLRFMGAGAYYAARRRFSHMTIVVVFNVLAWLPLLAAASVDGTIRMEGDARGLLDLPRYPLYVLLPLLWIFLMGVLPTLVERYKTAIRQLGEGAVPGAEEAVEELEARLNIERPRDRVWFMALYGFVAGVPAFLMVFIAPLKSNPFGMYWFHPDHQTSLWVSVAYHLFVGGYLGARLLWTMWVGHRATFKRLRVVAACEDVQSNPMGGEGLPGIRAMNPLILLTYFIALSPFLLVMARLAASGVRTMSMDAACGVLAITTPVVLLWPLLQVNAVLRGRRAKELALFHGAIERDYRILRTYYGNPTPTGELPANVKRAAETLPRSRELAAVVKTMSVWPWDVASTMKALLPVVASILAVAARFIGAALMKK